MDFGKVSPSLLDSIRFDLPEEPPMNMTVLKGVAAPRPQIFLGGTQWGIKNWVGNLYPKGTKDPQFLSQYVKQFNCVELNATHYKIYPPESIRKWKREAEGREFRFCPKFYQPITHEKTLNEHQDLLYTFLESVEAFEEKLGPLFLQLSERFSPARQEELYIFLENLPAHLSIFVEVRHPDWFQEPVQTQYFRMLYDLKKGAVITDTAGRRDACHMHLTLPKTFIRFVGNGLHPTNLTRIGDWALRLRHWLQHGLEEACFILHMPDETTVPELAQTVVQMFNKECGSLLQPVALHKPPELF